MGGGGGGGGGVSFTVVGADWIFKSNANHIFLALAPFRTLRSRSKVPHNALARIALCIHMPCIVCKCKCRLLGLVVMQRSIKTVRKEEGGAI